ncbi:hypothetical protein F4604DRAFT_1932023 [Suillus subluteus]|nr:hypothetical protein F4604DRAFT_1932023 [Suillus subluteus]
MSSTLVHHLHYLPALRFPARAFSAFLVLLPPFARVDQHHSIQQLLNNYNALLGDQGQQEGQGQQEWQRQQVVDQAQADFVTTTSAMGQQQDEVQLGFAITTSMMAFWDYVNAIMLERAQNHPHPPHLPVPMS